MTTASRRVSGLLGSVSSTRVPLVVESGPLSRRPLTPRGGETEPNIPQRCPICGKLEGDCGSFCTLTDPELRAAFMRAYRAWEKRQ